MHNEKTARMKRSPRRHVEGSEQRRTHRGRKRTAVIIGAGARGNRSFIERMATRETGWQVAGVVGPGDRRRAER